MDDNLLYSIVRRVVLVAAFLASTTATEAGSLIEAIEKDDLSQVEQEIANGADVTEEDMFLGPAIVLAAIRGNAQIVELLLDHGALVQTEDYNSGTPLHAAAVNGHLNVVEILIKHGANIDAVRASNGETPMHAAAEGGNGEIVELLISLGADVNARSSGNYGPIDSFASYGPIHSAALSDHLEVVDLLRAYGASPRPIDPVAPLLNLADPEEGAKIFGSSCGQCHTADKGGPNRLGPNLWGLVGRKRASLSDFDYSSALIRHGGAWTYETINAFIASPTDFIPGTKMIAFARTAPDRHERAHIIAYLRQLSDNPAPLPSP